MPGSEFEPRRLPHLRLAFALSFRASDRCHWRGNPHPPSLASPFGRGGRAQRGRRGQTKKGRLPAALLSVSINPLYGVRGSSTQGELEGAKPASNQIRCRAKPCLARRAWSTPRVLASRREATIFAPQGGTKITTFFHAVEKAGGFFDSMKEGPPPGSPSFMQFLQRFSTSRTPRQYPYRRRCTGWPGPSWPRAASASRAAG